MPGDITFTLPVLSEQVREHYYNGIRELASAGITYTIGGIPTTGYIWYLDSIPGGTGGT